MDGVAEAQKKLGVPVTGQWDPVTTGAVVSFQQRQGAGPHPMSPHGHPDPPTLANVGYYEPLQVLSPKQRKAAMGHPTSTFFRDVRSSLNQIPRWGWIAGAVVFGFMAWRSARSDDDEQDRDRERER